MKKLAGSIVARLRKSLIFDASYVALVLVLGYITASLFYVHLTAGELKFTPALASSATLIFVLAAFTLHTVFFLVAERRIISISLWFLLPLLIFVCAVCITWSLSAKGTLAFLGYALEPGTIAALVGSLLCVISASHIARKRQTLLLFFKILPLPLGVFVLLVLLIPHLQVSVVDLAHAYTDVTFYTTIALLITTVLFNFERSDISRFYFLLNLILLFTGLVAATLLPLSYLLVTIATVVTFIILKILYSPLYFAQTRLPTASLFTVALLLTFLLSQMTYPYPISSVLVLEERPSWSESFTIAAGTLRENQQKAFIGFGPSNFRSAWAMYRPIETNNQAYANGDFLSSRSYLLTQLVELGMVGTMAFLMVLTVAFSAFVMVLRKRIQLLYAHEVQMLAVFFLFGCCAYTFLVSHHLTLLILGTAVGLLAGFSGLISLRPINVSWKICLCLCILIIGASAALFYCTYKNTKAVIMYERSIIAFLNENDLEKARTLSEAAITFAQKPLFYRSIAQIQHRQMELLISKEEEVTDEDRESLRLLTTVVLGNIHTAIDMEPNNYLNWYILARVYSTMVLLGAPEARAEGEVAYREANKFAPNNALVIFSYAEHAYLTGQHDLARTLLQRVINARPDHREAHQLLRHIWEQETQSDDKSE